ncbi:hypothetical protein EVG20_g3850 [Dentipellis fragilis]|uniref:Uncharacterized protein n=1 Tax=Dentipellis fragilis TaxID=205917 RepID=A0A4Y9YZN1_9AGAM|nr:hypothetical protein EVG20_g3850 [Dentipellis fragilis]
MAERIACLITNEDSIREALAMCYITVDCDRQESQDLGNSWHLGSSAQQKRAENTVILRRDWHVTFVRKLWTLVPVKDTLTSIILQLLKCTEGGFNRAWDVICAPKQAYFYQLVSFKLGNLAIIRIEEFYSANQHPRRSSRNESCGTFYYSPYTDFPKLTSSQLHPYFVILTALSAFRANEGILTPGQVETYALLKMIRDLWYQLAKLPLEGQVGTQAPAEETVPHSEGSKDMSVVFSQKRSKASGSQAESASKRLKRMSSTVD